MKWRKEIKSAELPLYFLSDSTNHKHLADTEIFVRGIFTSQKQNTDLPKSNKKINNISYSVTVSIVIKLTV